MKKTILTLTIAATLSLGSLMPALAMPEDCKHQDVISINPSLEKVNPNSKTEEKNKESEKDRGSEKDRVGDKDEGIKLTEEQKKKKDDLLNEVKKSKEITRAKQQEVGNFRKEIKQKLDNLATQGKKLSEEQYSKIKEHLNKISSIQQEVDKERLEKIKNHKARKDEEKDFDTLMRELQEINEMEKKRLEKLNEIHNELTEVKKIIG